MLIYALPFMILRVNKRANKAVKNKIVKSRCEQFLQGKWPQHWKDTLSLRTAMRAERLRPNRADR